MKKEQIKEMEEKDSADYARIPSKAAEFEEWESEQAWSEDEHFEHEEAIQQTTTHEGTKAMEEALERAAEIRHQLEGRHHSDSTQDMAEDRQR